MRRSWKRIAIYSMPLIIMAFIFIQSSLRSDLSSEESDFFVEQIGRYVDADTEAITIFVRKTAHLFEYFALGISLYLSVLTGVAEKKSKNRRKNGGGRGENDAGAGRVIRRPSIPILAAVIGVLFSVSDEIHQRFVPGRSCEVRDVVIDSIGILCGILAAVQFFKRKEIDTTE